MRIKEIRLYQFDELSDEAKATARDWLRDATASDTYVLDEMIDSLKALFKASGIKLVDWSIGAYNQNNYVKFDLGDAADLTGARAMAWLENNLFDRLRITPAEFEKKRKEYMSYGEGYRIGKIKPCPLTGMGYDEDLLDAIRKSISSGETLKEAFKGLADHIAKMFETEVEYQNKDEQVEENIRANEYEFTVDGKRG